MITLELESPSAATDAAWTAASDIAQIAQQLGLAGSKGARRRHRASQKYMIENAETHGKR